MTKEKAKVDGRKGNSGRKSISKDQLRDIRNVVKTNKKEQATIKKRAAKAGVPVATYLRMRGLGEI